MLLKKTFEATVKLDAKLDDPTVTAQLHLALTSSVREAPFNQLMHLGCLVRYVEQLFLESVYIGEGGGALSLTVSDFAPLSQPIPAAHFPPGVLALVLEPFLDELIVALNNKDCPSALPAVPVALPQNDIDWRTSEMAAVVHELAKAQTIDMFIDYLGEELGRSAMSSPSFASSNWPKTGTASSSRRQLQTLPTPPPPIKLHLFTSPVSLHLFDSLLGDVSIVLSNGLVTGLDQLFDLNLMQPDASDPMMLHHEIGVGASTPLAIEMTLAVTIDSHEHTFKVGGTIVHFARPVPGCPIRRSL